MSRTVDVSVILPTWNRRDLVLRAIRSVIDQTVEVREIVVIDDGSTDQTEEATRALGLSHLRYLRQDRRGVSAARNAGLAAASGRYIAFLDSDDEWLPEKTDVQLQWLSEHQDFGMVLCDVLQVDRDGRQVGVLDRRALIPEDGYVLRWVLQNPMLAPASAMVRREVIDSVGLFREDLPTAEDLDFHLRVAEAWKIGVVSSALVRAMRGHDGLSELSRTYDDYVKVIEAAVVRAGNLITSEDRHRALSIAYFRASRGYLYQRDFAAALRGSVRAWTEACDYSQKRDVLSLLPLVVRQAVRLS